MVNCERVFVLPIQSIEHSSLKSHFSVHKRSSNSSSNSTNSNKIRRVNDFVYVQTGHFLASKKSAFQHKVSYQVKSVSENRTHYEVSPIQIFDQVSELVSDHNGWIKRSVCMFEFEGVFESSF